MAPTQTKPSSYLGALYHAQGRWAEAEAVYRAVFQVNPDDPEILNGLGFLYADWGVRLEEAATLIERALSQDPENGAYLDSLGWVTFRMNRPQEALRFLTEACRHLPDPEVFGHLGHVYLSVGDRRRAKEAWEKALQLKPKDEQLVRQLELWLKNLKNRKDR